MSIAIPITLLSLALPQDASTQTRWRLVTPSAPANLEVIHEPHKPADSHEALLAELLQPADLAAPAKGETPWIGVGLNPEGGDGLEVLETYDGSPARGAGLMAGDVIVSIDGNATNDIDALRAVMAERSAGDTVQLGLRRSIGVKLDERGHGDNGQPRLGVSLGGDGTGAWSVTEVSEGWPAAKAGVLAGDTVVAVQGEPLESFEQLMGLLVDVEPGAAFHMDVLRSLELTLGSRDGGPAEPGQTVELEVPKQEGKLKWRLAEPEVVFELHADDDHHADEGHGKEHQGQPEENEFVFEWHMEPGSDWSEVRDLTIELAEDHEHGKEHAHGDHEAPSKGIWVEQVPRQEGEHAHPHADHGEDHDEGRGHEHGGIWVQMGDDHPHTEPGHGELSAGILVERHPKASSDNMRELRKELRGLKQELRSLRQDIRRLSRDIARQSRGNRRGR